MQKVRAESFQAKLLWLEYFMDGAVYLTSCHIITFIGAKIKQPIQVGSLLFLFLSSLSTFLLKQWLSNLVAHRNHLVQGVQKLRLTESHVQRFQLVNLSCLNIFKNFQGDCNVQLEVRIQRFLHTLTIFAGINYFIRVCKCDFSNFI